MIVWWSLGSPRKYFFTCRPSNLGTYGAEPKRQRVRARKNHVSTACLWGLYFSFQMSHLQWFLYLYWLMDTVCLSECLIVVLTAGMFDVYHCFCCCLFLMFSWFFSQLFTDVGFPQSLKPRIWWWFMPPMYMVYCWVYHIIATSKNWNAAKLHGWCLQGKRLAAALQDPPGGGTGCVIMASFPRTTWRSQWESHGKRF